MGRGRGASRVIISCGMARLHAHLGFDGLADFGLAGDDARVLVREQRAELLAHLLPDHREASACGSCR